MVPVSLELFDERELRVAHALDLRLLDPEHVRDYGVGSALREEEERDDGLSLPVTVEPSYRLLFDAEAPVDPAENDRARRPLVLCHG